MISDSWARVKGSFPQTKNVIFSKAPGRINLIGEHTDYNGGLVLPAAVDKYAYFGFIKRQDDLVKIEALDLDESIEFSLSELTKQEKSWSNFFIGNLKTLLTKNHTLSGFECSFSSLVPIGGGMSSSSALECGFILGISELFHLNLSKWDIVDTSHQSNHNFLGLKGGIMDQFTSVFGKKNTVLKLDCSTREYEQVPLNLGKYSLLLIDTCISHDLVTSAYNERVAQCKSAVQSLRAKYPHIKHLSEIKPHMDISSIPFENENVKNRATYVIQENQRVLDFINAIQHLDYIKAGELMYESHEGLSDKYEVSCPELDFLVDIFRDDTSVLGSRMMGGGFGGCTINMVASSKLNSIKNIVSDAYLQSFGVQAKFYNINISHGASVLSS